MKTKIVDIVILSCLVISGALAVSSSSNSIIPLPVIAESPDTTEYLADRESARTSESDTSAEEMEQRREALSLVPEYLFGQAVHNAKIYGYTEVHKIGEKVIYYSYNPALKIGASWTISSNNSEDISTEYLDAKTYPALELMPLHIELEERNILAKFVKADYLKEGHRFLQTPTIAASYYRIDFSFDSLISLEKRTAEGGDIFTIEYFDTVHPELSSVISSLIDNLSAD